MVVVYILLHLIQPIVLKVGIIIFDKNEEIKYQAKKFVQSHTCSKYKSHNWNPGLPGL